MRATWFLAISTLALHCSVYSRDDIGNGARAGSSGASVGGAGGSSGARPDASTGGASGSTAGAAGTRGGNGGRGTGGAAGLPDATGGASGDAADGSATGGTGGSSGAGSGGASSTTGSGGAAGMGGAGASGSGGSGGVAGASGNGGAAGAATGGSAGSDAGDAMTDAIDAPDAPSDTPPAPPVFAVGSFAALPSTGTQVVAHPLGQEIKALLLWTMGKTNEVIGANYAYGIGVSDMATSVAFGASSQDEVSPSASSRRMASKIIALVHGGEVNISEADLVTANTTSFTLNWTVSDGMPYVIHYIAIGGSAVQAKVVNWRAPASPALATVPVGFQPDAVIHLHAGASVLSAPPTTLPNAVIGIGAMDNSGRQWAIQAAEASGVTTTIASRAQKSGAAVYMYNDSSPPAVSKEASIASMLADGFSLNFTSANTNETQIYSLALQGVRARAGTFDKSTNSAPVDQVVTTSFRPGVVFLTSFQRPATTLVREAICSFGLGASDGIREASSIVSAANGVGTTANAALDKTSKAFLKMSEPPLDGEADLTTFDANGFTMNWTLNDGVAAQICYLALGAP